MATASASGQPLMRGWLKPCALAALLALLCGPALADDPVLEGSGDQRWKNFYQELAQLKSGQRRDPLIILQLGDSHTAADYFSHTLRAAFQADYGDAGPGWLIPGQRRWGRSSLAVIAQSRAWQLHSSFSEKNGLWALGGFSSVAEQADQSVSYTLKSPPPVAVPARLTALLRRSPALASVKFYVDSQPLAAAAEAAQGDWQPLSAALDRAPAQFSLLAGESRVELAGVTLDYMRPGLIFDSIGIVGARINILDTWDQAALDVQFKRRMPALAILAFGTNEAWHRDFTRETYRAMLQRTVAWLARHLPEAAILLVAPPDGLQTVGNCTRRFGANKPRQRCLGGDDADIGTCGWRTHPNLAIVRAEQKKVALEQGWRYWDWSQVMGGVCGAYIWQNQEPPLYRPDGVHLFAAGYQRSAQLLYQAIQRDADIKKKDGSDL